MTAPALTVEIAFGSGYSTLEGSRSWTDVTQYVLQGPGADVGYGRTDEVSTAGPNSLALVLDNRDGRFTPEKTGGAYYPNVKVGTPIRVKATPSGGSASVRFTGYVDSWEVGWPGVKGTSGYAETRVTASSRLARLGLSRALRSIIEEEYLLDTPDAYYTLGEAAGATYAGDTSGNGAGSLTQRGNGTAVVFGSATGPGTDGLTAADFAGANGDKYLSGVAAVSAATALTLETFFTTSTSQTMQLVRLASSGSTQQLSLWVDLSGTVTTFLEPSPGGGASYSVTSAAVLDDGTTHHVAVVADQTSLRLYVDGVLAGTDVVAAWTLTADEFHIGGVPGSPTDRLDGVCAHVAYRAAALSGTRIAAHSDAGLTGFAGEVSSVRIERYAGYVGVPAAEFDAELGSTVLMAHVDTTGTTALDMMRKVEVTEGGVLFDERDGHIAFHDREHRYGLAVAFTFNVASGHVQPDYAAKLDRSALVNIAQAALTDGTVVSSVDNTTSRNAYGDHAASFELMTTDEDEPSLRAGWEVGVHGEPSTRVSTLTVELGKFSASVQANILALAVGSRIAVTNLMSQAPASSEAFFIEGCTESLQGVGGRHAITFNVSPAEIYDVWLLGDATYGVLGTTTKLAY